MKSAAEIPETAAELREAEGTFDMSGSLDNRIMGSPSTASTSRLDFDVVGAAAAQDDSALFERLMQRHQDQLLRVAYRMTGDIDEAQDLLQDALVEAYRAFAHFRRGTYFDKWLYRIMSRTFIDRKRSQRRAKLVSLDERMQSFGDGEGSFDREIADGAADPALRLQRSVMDHRIQEGLDRLSPEYRLVMILSDIEEFSYEEVAAFLECPIGTVRSRLHRARAQMREHLNEVGYAR